MSFLRIVLAASALLAVCALAQESKNPVTEKKLVEAAQKGFKLGSELNVASSASVEEMLLPPNVTRGLFARAVSARHAAVELMVFNRSQDAALIVHPVFLDYSRWLFSSIAVAGNIPACPPAGDAAKSGPRPLPACVNGPQAWQVSARDSRIAATEYRIARGTLLQAQQWSARNLGVRSLEFAGSVAAGYMIALKEPGFAEGIAAYNGIVLPAVRYLLPESSVDQANRISDLGFRLNKVIPKESSEGLVAFFPIDRFLTPGVKQRFEKSPATFFVPEADLFDPQPKKPLAKATPDLSADIEKSRSQMVEALKNGKAGDATRLLDSLSLNRIRVVVGGGMFVDSDTVPAVVGGVSFDESDVAMLWAEPGTKTGTIHGRFLGGGKVVLIDAGKVQITGIAVIQDGSSSESLKFSFKANKAIAAGQNLTFRVDNVDRSGDGLTITGKRFFSTDENALTVTLQPGSAVGVQEVAVKKFERKPTEIKLDLTTVTLAPACRKPQVTVGTLNASGGTAFARAPVPKIAGARKNGALIVVTGEQFVDLKTCGKELKFEVAEQAAGFAFKGVDNFTLRSAKEVAFDLPKTPADGKFKVRVLVAGVEADRKLVA